MQVIATRRIFSESSMLQAIGLQRVDCGGGVVRSCECAVLNRFKETLLLYFILVFYVFLRFRGSDGEVVAPGFRGSAGE